MKKIFIILATVSMTLAFNSCEKQNDDKNGGGNTDTPVEENARILEDFENGGILQWTGADGCSFEIADNPSKTGINTSDKCGKVTAGGMQWEFTWSTAFGGSYEDPDYLNFSEEGYIIKVDVYSPKSGSPVYLKIEGDGVGAVEVTTVTTTKVNEWETLEFDYEPYQVVDGAYRNVVILFDAGLETDGGEEFYYDNVRLCAE